MYICVCVHAYTYMMMHMHFLLRPIQPLKPANTLKNSLVHPKDKQEISRQSNVVYEICCNQNFACQDAYIDETSQPLQHNLKQHCRSSYNGNDTAVFKHIIAIGHQINVNGVTILDRGKLVLTWYERSCMGQKNPSLNCNNGTRNTPSHSCDRSINILCSFKPFPICSRSKNSTRRQHQHQFS